MVRLSEGVRFFAAVFSCSNLDGFKRKNFGCQSFGISGGGKKALSDEEASSLASSSNPAMTSSLVLTSVVLHRDPCFFRSFWSWNFVQANICSIWQLGKITHILSKKKAGNKFNGFNWIYLFQRHTSTIPSSSTFLKKFISKVFAKITNNFLHSEGKIFLDSHQQSKTIYLFCRQREVVIWHVIFAVDVFIFFLVSSNAESLAGYL